MITAITSIVVFAILFLGYQFLLANSKQFQLNRVILLTMPFLAFLATQIDFSFFTVTTESSYLLPEVQANVTQEISSIETEHFNVLWIIYLIGIGVFSCIFLVKLYSTIKQNKSVAGYSFLNKFYVNEDLNNDTKEAVVSHEKLHAEKLHSLDILFLELVKIAFWFNPLFPFFMRSVRLNHEFEADHHAAQTHENYSKILVSQQFNVDYALLGHSFSKSNLKQRLIMIESKKKSIRLSHYLLFACLAGASVTANAWIPEVTEQIKSEYNVPADDKEGVQPKYKGGMDALVKYLSSEIKYPKADAKKGTEGKVLVKFTVDAKGAIKDAEIKQGVSKAIDAEALRVVKSMPNWEPGTKKGKAASFEMTLPIMFKLEG